MAGDASSSASVRRRGQAILPLIYCPCCGWRKIVELVANTDANRGRIFYTCPNHKVRMDRAATLLAIAMALLGLGKEIAWLLKLVAAMCVFILFGVMYVVCFQHNK
ncbi:hypothetical protein ACP70R_017483 [Stipagrostis hirtigluma subsp. patula]